MLNFLRKLSISLPISCFYKYSDMYKLFYLSQLPPTVDKYYDNDKYVSKINNNLYIILKFQPSLSSDGPILLFWCRLIPQANLRM